MLGGLGQAGQVVDSAVGGRGERGRNREGVTSVAFWGICDIKYDPRLPKEERVKVLELGDGRSSRFSHHGRPIKEKFDREYCMDKNPPPIKRAVMVENKRFTHDAFVQEGFKHLRPLSASYERCYSPHLAKAILKDLSVDADGAVVLKLCNRSRGAGIVVVPGRTDELDKVLGKLLRPPCKNTFAKWLADNAPSALTRSDLQEVLVEQCLHWWSNECPVFLVERLCKSIPVPKQPGAEELFDGTMRVAFALHRKVRTNKFSHVHGTEEKIQPFEIDWLGGYWKLPKDATPPSDAADTLEGLHHRIVSSFNSVDKRTAEVPQEHLDEIYAALTPALPHIFHTGAFGVAMIQNMYKLQDPLFCGFALSRVAAAMRADDMNKATGLFDVARRMVPAPDSYDEKDLAERSVLSYIQRNAAVCSLMKSKWDQASVGFTTSLQTLPTNATSSYLLGTCHMELGMHDDAIQCMLRSITLDPDFKSPYVALGNIYLTTRKFESAIEAGVGCLTRNPDAPIAQFIIGQSIYHMTFSPRSRAAALQMREKAAAALRIARERVPDQWSESDEKMLGFLVGEEAASDCDELPVHTWRFVGYRP